MVPSLAKSAFTSILGALGAAAGPLIPNFLIGSNAAPIGPAASPISWTNGTFTAKYTGKVAVFGAMTVLLDAAGHNCAFTLIKDGSPLVTNELIAVETSGAGTEGVSFPAAGSLLWIDTVALNVAHTYGIEASDGRGAGHNLTSPTGFSIIVVYELP